MYYWSVDKIGKEFRDSAVYCTLANTDGMEYEPMLKPLPREPSLAGEKCGYMLTFSCIYTNIK